MEHLISTSASVSMHYLQTHPMARQLASRAAQYGVRLSLRHSREMKGLTFREINEDDLEDMESRCCSCILIISNPLSGISGRVSSAARHHIAVFISEMGMKSKQRGYLWNTETFHFTAFAFEFGLEGGYAASGNGLVSISAMDMEIKYANCRKPGKYAKLLENQGFKVEAFKRFRGSLDDAMLTAIIAGSRPYDLSDYNCKAYAKTVYNSIGQPRVIFESDASNNRLLKMAARGFISCAMKINGDVEEVEEYCDEEW